MRRAWLFLSFKGRINRARYWEARLFLSVLFAGLLLLIVALANGIGDRVMLFGLILAAVILVDVLVTWASLALDVKRLHDHDLSAWWLLFGLIPVLGVILPPIVLYFVHGDEHDNRYGADPVMHTAGGVTSHTPIQPNRRLLRALFEVKEPTWR